MNLSEVQIDEKALLGNLKWLKSHLGESVEYAAVVKANAYGHGEKEVVRALDKKVSCFQVDDIDEARRLRSYTKSRTLVLGYIDKANIKEAITLDLEIAIFSLEHAREIDTVAKKCNKKIKAHIAIDAHLGREGVLASEAKSFFKNLVKMKNILPVGMYAHFANIEDVHPKKSFGTLETSSHARLQIDAFYSAVKEAKACGCENIKTHMSATSGLLAFEAREGKVFDMVRLGVGLYGMWPSQELKKIYFSNSQDTLKPVMRLVTHLALVKVLPKGHTIGYGLTYKTKKKTKIGVVPLGYSDGIDRGLSNTGYVLLAGKKCKILGRVAMNMFVVDISKVEDRFLKDEVVVIGESRDKFLFAEEIADMIGTINYEVTTRISPLLPRKMV